MWLLLLSNQAHFPVIRVHCCEVAELLLSRGAGRDSPDRTGDCWWRAVWVQSGFLAQSPIQTWSKPLDRTVGGMGRQSHVAGRGVLRQPGLERQPGVWAWRCPESRKQKGTWEKHKRAGSGAQKEPPPQSQSHYDSDVRTERTETKLSPRLLPAQFGELDALKSGLANTSPPFSSALGQPDHAAPPPS